MEFCTAAKGLENGIGENNCFLNVVFQVFAHLPTFKNLFNMFTYEHVHERNLFCLLCEIRSLLLEYEYKEDRTLDPTILRQALAVCIEKFEKNKQACPVELFENLLEYFHSFSETCPARCPSHSVFGYEYCEETSCDCQKSFGDKLFDCVVRTYAAELFQLGQNMPGSGIDVLIGLSLASQAHTWPCTSCGKVKYLKKLILQKPKVLIISISWAEVSQRIISWLAEAILPVLLLRNLFSLRSEQPEYFSRYIFKGLVCFSSSHYVSFFYSLRRNQWVMFDDSTVKMMDSWTEVYTKLIAGKMKPVMLIYELDAELDKIKREYQLDYIQNEHINYLLDPDVYFESFNDVLALDLAGLAWKSDVLDVKDTKKCRIF